MMLWIHVFGVVAIEDTSSSSSSENNIRNNKWDRDIRIFHLYDEDNGMKHLSSFYLDPYKRPENKISGENFCISLVDRAIQTHTSTMGFTTTTVQTLPFVCIVCDIEPPMWNDSPCLLSFDEATNLFHEFGHALHQMLTTVDVGFVAGTNGVEFDAVEFPSQFLASWLYDKQTLQGFARHYRTGEKLPDELFDELVRQRSHRSSLRILNQTFEGQLEIELYTNHENESVLVLLENCYKRYTVTHPALQKSKKNDLTKVIDIFCDGNVEFRYRYLVSEIMSCDAFAAFEEVSNNEVSVKILGRQFRESILSTGGGCKASDAFCRFRGRDFEIQAFLRYNGLV